MSIALGHPKPSAPLNVRYAARAAAELGLPVEMLDPFSEYLIRIGTRGHYAFVGAGTIQGYPINSATIASVVTDKAHTCELLAREGLRVPQSQIVFLSERYADLRPAGRERSDAARFAEALGYPVFVKPNTGSRGNLAQSVNDRQALERHLDAIGERHDTAILQERVSGTERRLFYVDGEVKFGYAKTKPQLVGDGASSVDALLDEVDLHLLRNGLSPANRDDPVLAAALSAAGLTFASILPGGATLAYSEKANVSGGGGVTDFHTEFTADERALGRTVHACTGLRVCAIDTIDSDNGPIILELNANPALTSLEKLGETDLLLRIWVEILEKALDG
jgi:glutathione synthase/RimK-type ligase-like ATP-grasp enzyme